VGSGRAGGASRDRGLARARQRRRADSTVRAAASGIAVLAVLLAACGGGQQGTDTAGPARSTSAATAAPASRGSAVPPPGWCQRKPVAAPHHVLTFPKAIGGYRRHAGPFRGPRTYQLVAIGQVTCKTPAISVEYLNHALSLAGLVAGYHAARWGTFHAFWGLPYAMGGGKVTAFPAGPLGGQVECQTGVTNTECNWLDSDTFGAFDVVPDEGLAGTLRLMREFRAAIEHPG
jgi:hypothetical protein